MFYGRKDILDDLRGLWEKRMASLVTCRGRRRIGKSTLVEEFARLNGARFLKLEGKAPEKGMTNADQLKSFCSQLSRQVGGRKLVAESWAEAFAVLDEFLDGRKTVLLLDEISWMGKYDPGFAGDLKIAWDDLFKKHDRTIVFLCGSASTWIAENILNHTGFLGRRSMDIVLGELPLSDCFRFWGNRMSRVSTRDVIDVLSVTGGVPKYLEDIRPSLSADENIRRLCFRSNGMLVKEFEEIFANVFEGDVFARREILNALANGPLGVSDLAAVLGKERNGHLSAVLEELSLSGFVEKDEGLNPKTGKPVLSARYRLKDNYARFYLHCISPHRMMIDKDGYRFSSVEQLDGWDAIMGLQFENLVLNHISDLLPKLHIDAALLTSAAPYRVVTRKKGEGCQIDLLIQSKWFWYVVEIKRKRYIGREVVEEVARKVERLPHPRAISIRTALVYEGELSKAIEGDGYFDALVPIADLLGRS